MPDHISLDFIHKTSVCAEPGLKTTHQRLSEVAVTLDSVITVKSRSLATPAVESQGKRCVAVGTVYRSTTLCFLQAYRAASPGKGRTESYIRTISLTVTTTHQSYPLVSAGVAQTSSVLQGWPSILYSCFPVHLLLLFVDRTTWCFCCLPDFGLSCITMGQKTVWTSSSP